MGPWNILSYIGNPKHTHNIKKLIIWTFCSLKTQLRKQRVRYGGWKGLRAGKDGGRGELVSPPPTVGNINLPRDLARALRGARRARAPSVCARTRTQNFAAAVFLLVTNVTIAASANR